MDSLDVIRVCLKRWYIVLPVLLLAAGAGLGLARTSKATYTAAASFAFVWEHADEVAPREPDPRVKNPLAADGTGLLGESVVASLTSVASQERLGGTNRGYEPGQSDDASHFSILQDDGRRSYTVRTWADSPQQALDVVTGVLAAVPTEAEKLQVRAGAPKISRYSTFETSLPEMVRLPPESPVKLLVAVMGVGLLAAAALALVVDRLLSRRGAAATRGQQLQAPQEAQLAPRFERMNTYTTSDALVSGAQAMSSSPETDWEFDAFSTSDTSEHAPASESADTDLPPVTIPTMAATPSPDSHTTPVNGHASPTGLLGTHPAEPSGSPAPAVAVPNSTPPSPGQQVPATLSKPTRSETESTKPAPNQAPLVTPDGSGLPSAALLRNSEYLDLVAALDKALADLASPSQDQPKGTEPAQEPAPVTTAGSPAKDQPDTASRQRVPALRNGAKAAKAATARRTRARREDPEPVEDPAAVAAPIDPTQDHATPVRRT
ncbi:hypothetical protein LJR027_003180 [Terrabacter sp. LjRoot27]|uniref:hypothetical protein n=1 Tax=Terrabacter sp. LjRoot27 TaxID=3342306 RepID=UPI003ED04299